MQFIFIHFGIDLIRIAGIHTPDPLTTALSLIAALLIGQIAIDVGIFTPEVLLYGGMVAGHVCHFQLGIKSGQPAGAFIYAACNRPF